MAATTRAADPGRRRWRHSIRQVLPYGSGALFSTATRRRLVVAAVGSAVLAFVEVLGLVGVAALLQLLTGGSAEEGLLGRIAGLVGRPDSTVLTVQLALAVLVCFTAKGIGALFFRRWMMQFIARQEADTSSVLLDSYLRAPYALHQRRSTGDLLRTMYDGTAAAYSMVISPLVGVVPDALTILAIVGLLIVSTPVSALGAIVFLALAGLAVQRSVRPRADRAGAEMTAMGARAYIVTLQSLGGVKEIQVRRNADYFVDGFAHARLAQARARATAQFLTEMPRYALELVFIFSVAVATLLAVLTSDSSQQSLSAVGLFVAAGFRMLPSLVRVVGAVTSVRVGQPGLRLVIDDLADSAEHPVTTPSTDRVRLRRELSLESISFRYPETPGDVLHDVSFILPAGRSTALVGASGAGKSTLLDIVLGLHAPSGGDIRVDGVSVADRLPAWQRSIGLVPQDVFLLDESVVANVAFGVPADQVDLDRVHDCLRRAQLQDVVDAWPDGVWTLVGERGSRMSGGQRQRVGMARALYVEPDLLVLDEATSALDNETEAKVTTALHALHGEVAVLVVAHRLSTVRDCDQVVFMDAGRVAAVGTFDELRRDNADFERLVQLGELT